MIKQQIKSNSFIKKLFIIGIVITTIYSCNKNNSRNIDAKTLLQGIWQIQYVNDTDVYSNYADLKSLIAFDANYCDFFSATNGVADLYNAQYKLKDNIILLTGGQTLSELAKGYVFRSYNIEKITENTLTLLAPLNGIFYTIKAKKVDAYAYQIVNSTSFDTVVLNNVDVVSKEKSTPILYTLKNFTNDIYLYQFIEGQSYHQYYKIQPFKLQKGVTTIIKITDNMLVPF